MRLSRSVFGVVVSAVVAASVSVGIDVIGAQRQTEAPAPTGLLMGVVVDAQGAQPVPHAEVTLAGAPPSVRTPRVLTDAQGRFVFMDLPTGSYTITATKAGYAEGALGRQRPGGEMQPIALADAERHGDLEIPLWRLASISGRVVDEAGEPLVGITVQVLPRSIVAGRQKFTPGAVAMTDDRGMYRVASLVPGAYAVAVPFSQTMAPLSVVELARQGSLTTGPLRPGESDFGRELSFSAAPSTLNQLVRTPAQTVGTMAVMSTGAGRRLPNASMSSAGERAYVYPTQFYPSASAAADATVVTVGSGEERAGVDLQLHLAPTSRLSGIVRGPEGPMIAALSLVPDTDDLSTDSGLEVATTFSDSAGRFTFLGVPHGRHQLRAVWVQVPVGSGGSRGAPPPQTREAAPAPPRPALGGFTLWSSETVVVGEKDVDDYAVTLRPGFRVSGAATFAGATAPPPPDQLRRIVAVFEPADGRPLVSTTIGRGQFDEQGNLSSYQLPPGRYFVHVTGAPTGWTFESATVSGRDMSTVPVLIDRDVVNMTVSFTDRPSSLAGQVHNGSGGLDATATVLIFPADASGWSGYAMTPRRLRAVRVGRDGHFQTVGLPAGDYLVAAVADEATADWQDPVVLKAVARVATRVELSAGESRSVMLRTTGVPR